MKHPPSSLIVTKAHYEKSPEYLAKLIRGILYGERITNRQFHERYNIAFPSEGKLVTRNSNSRISALRGDIYNNEKLMSIYIFRTIVTVLGYDLVEMSVTIEHIETHEKLDFSTDMSLEDIFKMCKTGDKESFVPQSSYTAPPGYLSKLIRGIFIGLGITKKEFKTLYHERYSQNTADDAKGSSSRISAHMNDIKNTKKVISFYIFDAILRVLKYRIVRMGATIEDHVTKERRVFSTDMTGDDIDKATADLSAVGISSL